MKTVSPRDREFWTNESVERENFERVDYDQEVSKRFFKALDIAAEAFTEEFQEKTLIRAFPAFYREFVYIRALAYWERFRATSEEEKKEREKEKAEFEKWEKEFEKGSEDLEDDEEVMTFDTTEEDPDIRVLRFAAIMEKMPDQITDDMKIEAFKLFPEIFARLER